MESGKATGEAVHATVHRGPGQMRHDGVGRVGVDQSGTRSDVVLPQILSRRHLRELLDEHKRRQYLGLCNVIKPSL